MSEVQWDIFLKGGSMIFSVFEVFISLCSFQVVFFMYSNVNNIGPSMHV